MASYVERVLDFIERQSKNPKVPKLLQEDLEWAYETISSNKLYKGGLDGMKLNMDRPEVQAWMNMINLQILHIKQIEQVDAKKAEIKKGITGKNLGRYWDRSVKSNKDNFKQRKGKYGDEIKDEIMEDEFFTHIKIIESDRGIFESAIEKLDETQFDSFGFYSIIGDNSF